MDEFRGWGVAPFGQEVCYALGPGPILFEPLTESLSLPCMVPNSVNENYSMFVKGPSNRKEINIKNC